MNYFEILAQEQGFLQNNSSISKLPILKSLITTHLRREIITRSIGNSYNPANMLLSSHASYVTLLNFEYVIRKILFLFHKSKKGSIKKDQILLSPYMCSRFPDLIHRLSNKYNVLFFITALNFRFSRHQKSDYKLKIHNNIFNKKQTKLLKILFEYIRHDFLNQIQLRQLDEAFLNQIETQLESTVLRIQMKIESENISQFITCYDNRFDDLLIAHACKRAKIPSKELAHGVNNYTLQNGQTMAPATLDYLLVWKKQMRDACLDYGGDEERIQIIGYPKYTLSKYQSLQLKFPVRKQIIYFSQPVYDIFDGPSHKITPEIIELEKKFRLDLFKNIDTFAYKNDFDVIIRYHHGEKNTPTYSRDEEISFLEKNTKIIVSKQSFEQDIYQSEICLGINTSCIYESFLLNKKCFQIRFPLNDKCYHDEIPIISVSEILSLNSKKAHIKSSADFGFINDEILISIGK